MQLTSTAFKNNEPIPPRFTCDGDSVQPALAWSDVPQGVKSFVLLMEDPDISPSVKQSHGIDTFDHWVLFNISPETRGFGENEGRRAGTEGMSSTGKRGYVGPCPNVGEHRYVFTLYALNTALSFPSTPTKQEVKDACQGHLLAEAELMGRYQRT